MRLLYGHDKAVADFVADLIPQVRAHGFGECRAVGVIDTGGRLVAGWVWHHYWPEAGTIEFSGAAVNPRWMTRHILHELFDYAFNKANCQMLVTRNSATNFRLHRQLARYGFSRFDIPRLFGRMEDGVIWTLTREQWEKSDFEAKVSCAA